MKKKIILILLLIPCTFFAVKEKEEIKLNKFDQTYRQFLTTYGTAMLIKIRNNEKLDPANYKIELIENANFKKHMTASIKAYNFGCDYSENKAAPIFIKMLQQKAERVGIIITD